MKWYPWLNNPYRNILSCYQQTRGHQALLLRSQLGNGMESLCYALTRWLMCEQPLGIKSCNVCQSCRLMVIGNHPDFYQLQKEKNHKSLGVDNIRIVINSIYDRSRQGRAKVVFLPQAQQLTEQAVNALLKVIEEPPEETYFILSYQLPIDILPTLKSRCLCWPPLTPNKLLSQKWLQKIGYNDGLLVQIALHLCGNAPLEAENLLQPTRWQARQLLCKILQDSLITNDFLALLPIMNNDQDIGPLRWLLSLLADSIKWKQGTRKFLINIDKIPLVTELARRWSAKILHKQWQQWLFYFLQCLEINGVNRELLLAHHLLNLEHGVTNIYTSL